MKAVTLTIGRLTRHEVRQREVRVARRSLDRGGGQRRPLTIAAPRVQIQFVSVTPLVPVPLPEPEPPEHENEYCMSLP